MYRSFQNCSNTFKFFAWIFFFIFKSMQINWFGVHVWASSVTNTPVNSRKNTKNKFGFGIWSFHIYMSIYRKISCRSMEFAQYFMIESIKIKPNVVFLWVLRLRHSHPFNKFRLIACFSSPNHLSLEFILVKSFSKPISKTFPHNFNAIFIWELP